MKTQQIYQTVTQSIIEYLKRGVRPWQKPWDTATPLLPLRFNGVPYRGINTLILWMASEDKEYSHSTWMTFKQAKDLGGSVRKGEKGTSIVFTSKFTKKESNEEGEEQERTIPFLKSYTVFNANQIDDLPERFSTPSVSPIAEEDRDEHCDEFFEATGADLRHGGDRAFYHPHKDYIQLPQFMDFVSSEAYYATLAHESIHWTGHKSRLGRELLSFKTSPEEYAFEELVAELGSAFVCARLGLTLEVREDHASYIEHWLGILEENDRAIFRAASLASKASEFLFEKSFTGEETERAPA